MTDVRASARQTAREAIVADGRLRYPDELPITGWRDEIVDAIATHPVVVVAGETGSGKSTQLPKLCIEAGRGAHGMIGHTQPRRVAARSVAERVAQELGSSLGADVGYAVRFTDTVGDGTVVKVMTDGILLAEIQRDRMLRRYDTIVVDEAHERSLNIDFILGYLRRLLTTRDDLRVIVTSATIDTERFARHFGTPTLQPAPIIEVTGRSHPVEIRYRPLDERDQVSGVVAAVGELRGEGSGDILVFLSGEREIHDVADAVRSTYPTDLDILPLYARLSAAEQHRIFEPHRIQRVVLATNVAETSLTVPGVRYVVDAGTARISRYSRRLKVQQLPIEPVSQASANQRAGRCGRVAPGICIRLYGEDDFTGRPEFTEPEILRTNLAAVILQMTAAGLGDVTDFPFVEAPDRRSIRDGYLLLEELGAVTRGEDGSPPRLTSIGRRLAKLPVDPRLGRMILEAERLRCVREVLVIASALSMQDVRERPQDRREQADQLHARFRVDGSDLLGIVALWDHVRSQQRAMSGNRFRRMCREEFLHYLRVREWGDLYSQLRRVAGDLGMRVSRDGDESTAHPDHVHQAVLAGLLSHVGVRDRETRAYRGARDSRFVIAPGSVLTRRPPEWVMAAELVETSQLYARRVAAVDPRWMERAGAHLVKRSYGTPRWDRRAGRAVTTETVTLYGLPLVTDRVIGLDRVDPDAARAWFITKALVEGDTPPGWADRHAFVGRNAQFRAGVGSLADRLRRVEVVDDEMLFDFFDGRVGDEVSSTAHFDRWWKQARRADPELLTLDTDALFGSARDSAVDIAAFPDVWRQPQGDTVVELPLTYRYAPGEPLDGVTVHVPLSALNQVRDDGFDWQVAGHRAELVERLVRSLPKATRRSMIPFADTLAAVTASLPPDPAPGRRLVDVLAEVMTGAIGEVVRPGDFDVASLPPHLVMNVVVSDDDAHVHAVGTDLSDIRTRLAPAVRSSIARATPIEERRGIVEWDVGDLPQQIVTEGEGLGVTAYPTLLDVGDSVALRVVTSPELQRRVMRGGVRRLLILGAAPSRAQVERLLGDEDRLALAASELDVGDLVGDVVAATIDELLFRHGSLPWTAAEFAALRSTVRRDAPTLAASAYERAARVVIAASNAAARLRRLSAPSARPSVDDASAHLGRLVHPGFVFSAGVTRLDDVERYVTGLVYRLDHLAGGIERDRRAMEAVVSLEDRFASLVDSGMPIDAELADVRWQLEDLRLATFAQPLVTKRPGKTPVSAKRIAATLDRVTSPAVG